MTSKFLLALALAAFTAGRPSNMSSDFTEPGENMDNVDQNSPYILDDMVFVDGQVESTKGVLINVPSVRWTNGIVPYVIDGSLSRYTWLIEEAMRAYNTHTCIRFQPQTIEQNYLRIFRGPGCSSNVGMIGGGQTLSLGQGCMYKGTIIHELGHALGFFHEQNRSDRDQYVDIMWENIQSGMDGQFFLLKNHEETTYDDSTYDCGSIMHYGPHAFSNGRGPTMSPKYSNCTLKATYYKDGLTKQDIYMINKAYKCPETSIETRFFAW